MVLALPLALFAQGTISGTVTDASTGDPLAGANVVVEGTSLGAAANTDGSFTIENVPMGAFTVTASMIGYASASQTVNVRGAVTVNFALEVSAYELSALEVLASRATRETPVAFTDVKKEEMELRLGSRDIPLVLNTTPSVYATAQGGGAGDARVNVRGFNQRNVAILINGVPVNDMENAWVYWSNWDGVGDATSSIQVQRGLSAVNLATPSIGGTMNIITDPAAHKAGGKFKQEIGEWGFLKTTLSLNSGLINDKLALSGTFVKKTGDGYYGATWTDAYAWYLGASYAVSSKDRFELYALGAPQRHGQNLYKQNIAVYDEKFARNLDDYDESAIYDPGTDEGEYQERGRDFNQNWAPVNESYNGKQFWGMYRTHDKADRYAKNFLNERENFFHKPQVNLNWYHTFNDKMNLSSIVYWSGGHGGGTGTYGTIVTADATGKTDEGTKDSNSFKYYYGPSPWIRDWNATIRINSNPADTVYVYKRTIPRGDKESIGILRNSRNNQWTIGVISKLNYDVSNALKTQIGIDWRTAEIDHFREVRDLLGGDYFVYTGNDFDLTAESQKKKLGDKIAYYNTNTVDWLGFYGQAEYKSGPITAYGMAAYTTIGYTYTDHFTDARDDGVDGNENSKGELYAENKGLTGTQLKGGGMFRLSENLGIFANFGIVNKPPIFDYAISDYDGTVYKNPEAEKFRSLEFGLDMSAMDGAMSLKANYYNTDWLDRFKVRGFTDQEGNEGYNYLKHLDANHSGFELELAFQPMSLFRVDAAISLGDWVMTDNVDGSYKNWVYNDSTGQYDEILIEKTYYVKGLKVGDAPQTQMALGVTVTPISGLSANLVFKHYDNFYADWNPFDRETEELDENGKIIQSWKSPAYNLVDLHTTFELPIKLAGTRLQLFAHVFNLLDEEYIQDATDNSEYNAWDYDHDADDAEVFFGLPRSWNVGLNVIF
jgi:outer membrane cobalamin receptor